MATQILSAVLQLVPYYYAQLVWLAVWATMLSMYGVRAFSFFRLIYCMMTEYLTNTMLLPHMAQVVILRFAKLYAPAEIFATYQGALGTFMVLPQLLLSTPFTDTAVAIFPGTDVAEKTTRFVWQYSVLNALAIVSTLLLLIWWYVRPPPTEATLVISPTTGRVVVVVNAEEEAAAAEAMSEQLLAVPLLGVVVD
jgi:hypothetical protein